MAAEEIVIVEENDGFSSMSFGEPAKPETEKKEIVDKKKERIKKILRIGGLAAGVALIIGAIALAIMKWPKSEKVEVNVSDSNKSKLGVKQKISISEMEQLIKKAKALYENGDKAGALKIFEEISIYSEGVSNYNLGVAKMHEGDPKGALEYFKSSIESADNELPSAINAAVCMLKLGDKKAAREYIALAKASLPRYTSSPLYSFYYTMISYYDGDYFEALSSIHSPTSKFFQEESAELAKRAYLLFDDPYEMLKILKNEKNKDYLNIGFLEARVGRYDEAINALENAKKNDDQKLKAAMGEALVYIKAKNPQKAADSINEATTISEQNASNMFNIEIFLRHNAFETSSLQDKLLNQFLLNQKNEASLIFYYAPYKVFNSNKTISSIKKGQAGIMVDDIKAGIGYLENAAKQSKVNAEMVRGIDYALSGRVYQANKLFKSLEPKYPAHAVLMYNLGLSYAQSGDFKEANKYFIKAYNFDPKNYEAGIFSVLTSKIMGVPYDRVKDSLTNDIFGQVNFDNKTAYSAMFAFALDNYPSALTWIGSTPNKNNMLLTIGALASLKVGKKSQAVTYSKALTEASTNDIVASGLDIFVKNSGSDIKSFARETQMYLNKKAYNIEPVFYGPEIAKDMFLSLHRASGLLAKAKEMYEARLQTEKSDRAQLLNGYGATLMYLKMFKEAREAYSAVVMDTNFVNAQTLFMAGASAIASGKHSDAISYFELAKLYDPASAESLYALGVLYLEAANLPQSSKQFKSIKGAFESDFFDFDIK